MSKINKQEDLVRDFISEYCEVTESARVNVVDLYNSFQDWFVTYVSCCRLPSAAIFSRTVNKKFEKEKTCGGRRWIGLKIKENKKQGNEAAGVILARQLMKQIDDSGEWSAFWMVSCLSKLKNNNPRMNLTCLMNIIKTEMPKAFDKYREYLKNT